MSQIYVATLTRLQLDFEENEQAKSNESFYCPKGVA